MKELEKIVVPFLLAAAALSACGKEESETSPTLYPPPSYNIPCQPVSPSSQKVETPLPESKNLYLNC